MRFGFLALPLGLLEMVLIAVVIILIFKAISGNKQVGKTIAAVLVAISIMVIVMVVFAGLALFSVRQVAVNETTQQQAVMVAEQARVEAEHFKDQAHTEAERAKERVLAMEAEVNAKANEINNRVAVQMNRVVDFPPTPADSTGVSVAVNSKPSSAELDSYVDPATGLSNADTHEALAGDVGQLRRPNNPTGDGYGAAPVHGRG